MNRRDFLASFAAAIAAAIDLERLLWVPGERLISIPAPSRPFTYNSMFEVPALLRVGDVFTLRQPARFYTRTGTWADHHHLTVTGWMAHERDSPAISAEPWATRRPVVDKGDVMLYRTERGWARLEG